MSNPVIQANSLVTLHYRISLENGQPLISTYEATPATLQLGQGEIAAPIEQCLQGLQVGTHHVFTLAPAQAFGEWKEELVEHVKRSDMIENELEPMSIMEFTAPDGQRYSGLVREVNDIEAVIDFNHPLSGKTIILEVDVIGAM